MKTVQTRLGLVTQLRALKRALEDVRAARQGGLLTFAVPNPQLEGLTDADLIAALLRTPERVAEVPSARIPGVLGLLRLVEARLVWRELHAGTITRVPSLAEEGKDRLLNPEEAAQMIGVTVAWLSRRSRRLPFARKLSHKVVRYSEAGIRRWLTARARS